MTLDEIIALAAARDWSEQDAAHARQAERFHYVRDPDCSCRMSAVHSASLEPPHEIVDEWCPTHGRDPDAEAERRAEDREFFRNFQDED